MLCPARGCGKLRGLEIEIVSALPFLIRQTPWLPLFCVILVGGCKTPIIPGDQYCGSEPTGSRLGLPYGSRNYSTIWERIVTNHLSIPFTRNASNGSLRNAVLHLQRYWAQLNLNNRDMGGSPLAEFLSQERLSYRNGLYYQRKTFAGLASLLTPTYDQMYTPSIITSA